MFPEPRRQNLGELLDEPDGSFGSDELAGTLSDIRMVNRRLGGTRASLRHMEELATDIMRSRASGGISVLDVAAGSADIPVAVVEWARLKGIEISVTALDINRDIVGHAMKHVKGYPEIKFVVGDGLALPFIERSFDIVHCSTALHHFSDTDAQSLLCGMARMACFGLVVSDLRRSWVAYGLIILLTRFLTDNRLTRNDGPVSVLRSFTPGELSRLAGQAGLDGFSVHRHPFWRMALVWRGP